MLAVGWLAMIGFLGWNLFSFNSDDRMEEVLAQLGQCKRRLAAGSLDHLHTEIRNLQEELESTKRRLEQALKSKDCPPCEKAKCQEEKNTGEESHAGGEPWSLTSNIRKREKLRRRVQNTVREMWFYIRRQVAKARDAATGDVQRRLGNIVEDLKGYYEAMAVDLNSLGDIGGMKEWRQGQVDKVSAMIKQRIEKLQEPSDCSKAKRLVCDIGKGCGFGCQIHHVFYCMATAFGTGRTFIMQGNSWSYSRSGWNGVFLPTSQKCESYGTGFSMWRGDEDESDVVKMPIIDGVSPRPKSLPLAVPKEFIGIIEGFHSYPSVYWFGHIARYIMRYAPAVKKSIEERMKEIGFKHPIVG